MADVSYQPQGGVHSGLDEEYHLLQFAQAASTAALVTKFKKVIGANFTVFGGTNTVLAAAIGGPSSGTAGTTAGKNFGYVVGTSGTNIVTVKLSGTADDTLHVSVTLLGNS